MGQRIVFIQCTKIFENPNMAMKICGLLASKIKKELNSSMDLVLCPAIGGIIVGYEIGKHLGIKTIFCEHVNGKFESLNFRKQSRETIETIEKEKERKRERRKEKEREFLRDRRSGKLILSQIKEQKRKEVKMEVRR